MTTSAVANAILTGKFPPDVWVAAPPAINSPAGRPRWLRALDVPVIASLIEALPTRRPDPSASASENANRDSGMRKMPTPLPPPNPPPRFKKIDTTARSAGTPNAAPRSNAPRTTDEMPVVLNLPSASAADPSTAEPIVSSNEPIPMTDRDSEPAPTIRSTNPRGEDGFPIPTPEPTPTPTPPQPLYRGGETLESPHEDNRPRRKTLAM